MHLYFEDKLLYRYPKTIKNNWDYNLKILFSIKSKIYNFDTKIYMIDIYLCHKFFNCRVSKAQLFHIY